MIYHKNEKSFFFLFVNKCFQKIGLVKKLTRYNEILMRELSENVYYDIQIQWEFWNKNEILF